MGATLRDSSCSIYLLHRWRLIQLIQFWSDCQKVNSRCSIRSIPVFNLIGCSTIIPHTFQKSEGIRSFYRLRWFWWHRGTEHSTRDLERPFLWLPGKPLPKRTADEKLGCSLVGLMSRARGNLENMCFFIIRIPGWWNYDPIYPGSDTESYLPRYSMATLVFKMLLFRAISIGIAIWYRYSSKDYNVSTNNPHGQVTIFNCISVKLGSNQSLKASL